MLLNAHFELTSLMDLSYYLQMTPEEAKKFFAGRQPEQVDEAGPDGEGKQSGSIPPPFVKKRL